MKKVRLKLKNSIKKRFVALAMVIGCFLAFGIYALASEEGQFLIEITDKQDSYNRGDQIEVKVKLDTEEEYNGVDFMLEYDHEALELLTDYSSAPDSSNWITAMCGEAQTDTKGISCGYLNTTPNQGSKDLATFTFKIRETDNVLGDI